MDYLDDFYRKKESSTTTPFTWWIKFLNCLYHLPHPTGCRDHLIAALRDYYKENPSQLTKIDAFANMYDPQNAILWYTRETFVYVLLNSALRRHDIDLTFLFGFYLQDMYRQLKDEMNKSKDHLATRAYRGQLIHQGEIQSLKQYPHRVLINNSFLSTTGERNVASMYQNSGVQPIDAYQNLIFEIEIFSEQKTMPYASIRELSAFSDEAEILFMPGTFFDLIDIVHDETKNLLVVKLILSRENYPWAEKDFQGINGKQKLYHCAKAIGKIADDQAYRSVDVDIFDYLIDLFPAEKWLLAMRWAALGIFKMGDENARRSEAISDFQNALQIWNEYIDDEELDAYCELGDIHYKVAANCYRFSKKNRDIIRQNYQLALENYQLALDTASGRRERESILDCLKEICEDLVDIAENREEKIRIGQQVAVYQQMGLKSLPDNPSHGDVTIMVLDLEHSAEFQIRIRQYDAALLFYEHAVEILRKQKEGPTAQISSVYRKIATIYFKFKNNLELALKYQLLKHDSTDSEKGIENNFDLAESHLELAEIYIALKQYELAVQHLNEAKKFIDHYAYVKCHREIVASYYEYVADISLAQNELLLAKEYLRTAMKCYQDHQQSYGDNYRNLINNDFDMEEWIAINQMKIDSIRGKLQNIDSQ